MPLFTPDGKIIDPSEKARLAEANRIIDEAVAKIGELGFIIAPMLINVPGEVASWRGVIGFFKTGKEPIPPKKEDVKIIENAEGRGKLVIPNP